MSEQEEGASGKQVIARAASVLKALENQRSGLTLSQISKASGLPRTTVHRLVTALEAQQFVMSGSDGVRLGPALVRLAASAHTDIISIARPFIEALGRTTRETVDLCVYRGHHSVLVDQYPSDRELRVVSALGTAFPIHCTAHGKAILAELPLDLLDSLLERRLDQRATNTIYDKDRLLEELAAIRDRGYAIDEQEHAEGVYGISVFLRTGLSDHYAIAVAVPQLRYDREADQILHALRKCKAEIESILRSTR
ncbi:IclR family transcriptional regulator [Pseudomonas kairouanensis]|uniref:IclR family transcriptional regulator n=1 Tax=Pseudomonas kairouanensis TaxID=2293832 RepID=A0A4Z0AQ56_9PSED|nr:IclR family transcriptional regulator [Pseudomonas kairouanensis]TFY88284.1 IclR family transcriptional regulator [Pseudomonas kairouanensis]